ncbi:MAG TPA: hypothetical protein VHC69_35765 [Polyangiaceae bacterium]|nr:hypothetical protein [Polyangiaceae bacterium]
MKRRGLSVSSAALACGAALVVAPPARAVVGGPPPAASAAPADDEESSSTCKETFPAGAERPRMTESFPDRGKSGYALVLDVTVVHGKGESILPSGLGAESTGEAMKALEAAGFYLPNAKGASAPKLETKVDGNQGQSHLTIPVVALPKKPGRAELTLPPLPIAMARASGEVRTLCTAPHTVVLEDPIANTPDPKPRGNPGPVRQLEEWTAAKYAAIGAACAAVVAALVAFLIRLWRRRPRPVPPPPPPRPPWEVALEELFDVRVAQLVEQGRFAEHFDRVSDAVRRYLGARYGFDGLETTTHEAMSALRRVSPFIGALTDIESFLHNADLVKFAKLTPTEPECHSALGQAEEIVRRTMPVEDRFANLPAPAAPQGGAP